MFVNAHPGRRRTHFKTASNCQIHERVMLLASQNIEIQKCTKERSVYNKHGIVHIIEYE